MNSIQGCIVTALNRHKKAKEVSKFSITRNNPLIEVEVALFQRKSKKIIFDTTTLNKKFDEVRDIIKNKIGIKKPV